MLICLSNCFLFAAVIDTGWINLEQPLESAKKMVEKHHFQTPLDEVDAAARVLDPVLHPLVTAVQKGKAITPHWGVFLKDYFKCEW